MFDTKDGPGAGSGNRRNRTIKDTVSRMEGHVSLRPFAEHSRGRGEAARVELKRSLRASEEALQRLIEASLPGVLSVHTRCAFEFPVRDAGGKVSGLGAFAADVAERTRAEARRTISLCRDGGKRGR